MTIQRHRLVFHAALAPKLIAIEIYWRPASPRPRRTGVFAHPADLPPMQRYASAPQAGTAFGGWLSSHVIQSLP